MAKFFDEKAAVESFDAANAQMDANWERSRRVRDEARERERAAQQAKWAKKEARAAARYAAERAARKDK